MCGGKCSIKNVFTQALSLEELQGPYAEGDTTVCLTHCGDIGANGGCLISLKL